MNLGKIGCLHISNFVNRKVAKFRKEQPHWRGGGGGRKWSNDIISTKKDYKQWERTYFS